MLIKFTLLSVRDILIVNIYYLNADIISNLITKDEIIRKVYTLWFVYLKWILYLFNILSVIFAVLYISHENEISSRLKSRQISSRETRPLFRIFYETRRDEIARINFSQMWSFLVKSYYSEENRLKLLNWTNYELNFKGRNEIIRISI